MAANRRGRQVVQVHVRPGDAFARFQIGLDRLVCRDLASSRRRGRGKHHHAGIAIGGGGMLLFYEQIKGAG